MFSRGIDLWKEEIINLMKHNYGISILRVILAFRVVCAHFSKHNFPLNVISLYAVPCFMLLSFIFLRKHLDCINKEVVKNRIKKLAIPYITIPYI